MREIVLTPTFERLFKRLPKRIRDATYEKLALFLEDAAHPSLRVKRIRGTERIWTTPTPRASCMGRATLARTRLSMLMSTWEMSITMNYRLTFEVDEERMFLRRLGTHDVLRPP